MSFPPFILPCLTVAAVQSVVDPCNIALYLHSKNPYLHSISRTSCNKHVYILEGVNAVFSLMEHYIHIATFGAYSSTLDTPSHCLRYRTKIN